MNDSPSGIAARLNVSEEFARDHLRFPHHCVDGKQYTASCLVSDPDMTRVAYYYMTGLRVQLEPFVADPEKYRKNMANAEFAVARHREEAGEE